MRLVAGALACALAVVSAEAQGTTRRPYRRGIDVLDYAITIALPDSGATIEGDATLTVRRTARVDTLVLDLRKLRVERVALDGKTRKFARTDSTILVPLPRGNAGTFAVRVVYGGTVTDGLIARKDSLERWTYFGDNWPNRARYWIPSVDHPSDKATVTWTVRAPRGRTIVANGTNVETKTSGTGRRARVTSKWRESQPIPPYLMVIAASPLARVDLGQTACGLAELARCVPQSVYVQPELRRTMPGAFASAPAIVRYFASRVGPFPYEKLAHVQSSTKYEAMENASAIFYGDSLYHSTGVKESTIAHETAHQWFGDAVTEREWAHVWLSEGFADYFAALWALRAHGDSAFRTAMRTLRDAVVHDTVAVPRRPVIDTIETDINKLLNRNTYEKGAFVLHMLRTQLGDKAFFAGLRDYYMKHRHATALTSDLQESLETASGRKLGDFFEQWLRRPGYPDVEVTWSTDSIAKSVTVSVNQAGDFGAFEFPLELGFADSSGASRRVSVAIPAQAETQVQFPISAPVTRVEVDPDVELLARITVKRGIP